MARNKDYIPTFAEKAAEHERIKEHMKNTPDPRHEYQATCFVDGKKFTETVIAFNADEAERQVKQQWSLVGKIPFNLNVQEAPKEA